MTAFAIALSLAGCASEAIPADAARTTEPPRIDASIVEPCRTSDDCAAGEVCAIARAGCDAVGQCEVPALCARRLSKYCACDHVTFTETCNGPDRPYTSSGPCAGSDTLDGFTESPGDARPDVLDAGRCGSGVNLASDPLNCGACGNRCPPNGPFCVCGGCLFDCSAGMTACCRAGPLSGPQCVSLQDDPFDCGACGHLCAASEACVSGICVALLARDASTYASALCPPGECIYAGSTSCRPAGGPLSGCCTCVNDGTCAVACR